MSDAGLARIAGRIEAKRDRLRAELEALPDLRDLAEAIKGTWNATERREWERLCWFRFGADTYGQANPGPTGVPISPPPPNALKRRKPRETR